jgi:hypothetical protein
MSGGSDTEEYGSDGRKVKKPKLFVSAGSRSAALERYLAQWDRLDAMAPERRRMQLKPQFAPPSRS